MANKIRKTSATTYLLLALLPYTEPNMKLAFKPNQFFDDLDKLTDHSKSSLQIAFKRAINKGWVQLDDKEIKLSLEARQSIEPFVARKLSGAKLMVIFDIPENLASLRQKFRLVLKQLGFIQIQQSVWMTDRDYHKILVETINKFDLNDYIEIYEAVRIK
jgi:DNA-binding transcriptional regulator PaaX